jgi:hypothetical protein
LERLIIACQQEALKHPRVSLASATSTKNVDYYKSIARELYHREGLKVLLRECCGSLKRRLFK